MAKIGIHVWVSGKVQGVFYRASTVKQAKALGLTGWVKNLADGRVELQAFGEAAQVVALKEWLHQGPSGAAVTAVDCQAIAWQAATDFMTKRT